MLSHDVIISIVMLCVIKKIEALWWPFIVLFFFLSITHKNIRKFKICKCDELDGAHLIRSQKMPGPYSSLEHYGHTGTF